MDVISYLLGKNASGGGGGIEFNAFIDTTKTYSTGSTFKSLVTTIKNLDTSEMTALNGFFASCPNLADVPVLNVSKATHMDSMFQKCPALTDESLNNILLMCIGTTSAYVSGKTLAQLGFTSTNYPASRIEALPNYQDFIDAGWTIGY